MKTKDYTRKAIDKYRDNLKNNPDYADKAERAKARQKAYYQANKEKISKRAKEYYERKKLLAKKDQLETDFITVDGDFSNAELKM